jgi:hypothetical protein
MLLISLEMPVMLLVQTMLGVTAEPPGFSLDCLATTNLDFFQIYFICNTGGKALRLFLLAKAKRRHLLMVDNEIVYLRNSGQHFYSKIRQRYASYKFRVYV